MQLIFTFLTFISIFSVSEINAICRQYENAVWKLAGTNCGRFCSDIGKHVMCPPWRYHLGCFCRRGYYMDKNLKCVLPELCGSELIDPEVSTIDPVEEPVDDSLLECPPNEIYDNCSSRCLELCINRNDPLVCPIKCDIGCFCKGPRLRNDMRECIPQEECPKLADPSPRAVCSYGEVFLACGNPCRDLCPIVMKSLGQSIDCIGCKPGCYCEEGYLRDQMGSCVKGENCDRNTKILKFIQRILNMFRYKRRSRTGLNTWVE